MTASNSVLAAIRRKMAANEVEAFLVSNGVNRRYLSGFTGSAGYAVLTPEKAYLLTDFRYVEQAKTQCPDWSVITFEKWIAALDSLLQEEKVHRLAFEEEHITVKQERQLTASLHAALTPCSNWVEDERIVKTPAEVAVIERAAGLADEAFRQILPEIRPGVSENDLALELEYRVRKLGAAKAAFAPIVAAGSGGAMPHHAPDNTRLKQGDLVVIDFGCEVDGYCSDMTRTVCLGPPTQQQQQVYDIVLAAQRTGLDKARAGLQGRETDAAARAIIVEAGYGEYFGHGLGHGLGLQVHEAPTLARRGTTVLQPGMVVTIEPGIYIPGWGGIRIEDLVIITKDEPEILTGITKDLLQL